MLAFSAISNDDKIGLLLFHDEVDQYIPPRKGQKHALRVVREVLARGREESADDILRTRRGPDFGSLPRTIGRRLREQLVVIYWYWRRTRVSPRWVNSRCFRKVMPSKTESPSILGLILALTSSRRISPRPTWSSQVR